MVRVHQGALINPVVATSYAGCFFALSGDFGPVLPRCYQRTTFFAFSDRPISRCYRLVLPLGATVHEKPPVFVSGAYGVVRRRIQQTAAKNATPSMASVDGSGTAVICV